MIRWVEVAPTIAALTYDTTGLRLTNRLYNSGTQYEGADANGALDCETIAATIRVEVPMFDPSIGSGTRFRKGVSGNPGGRPRTRLLSEALRTRLADVKPDDPAGRTFAEVVAANLIEIACTEGPGAVHAASEIADPHRRPFAPVYRGFRYYR